MLVLCNIFWTKIRKMLIPSDTKSSEILWPLFSKAQLVMCYNSYNWLLFWPNSQLVALMTAGPLYLRLNVQLVVSLLWCHGTLKFGTPVFLAKTLVNPQASSFILSIKNLSLADIRLFIETVWVNRENTCYIRYANHSMFYTKI